MLSEMESYEITEWKAYFKVKDEVIKEQKKEAELAARSERNQRMGVG